MGIWKSPVLYEDCMKPGCIEKSNTNNLPAPTDLNENPYMYGKKRLFFKDANQKSARVVPRGIEIKVVPREPILKNVLIFEKKGGCWRSERLVIILYHCLNLIWRLWFSIYRQVLHFCMWNFVSADKANWALSAETKFRIQKYDGLENIENPSRALEVKL